MQSQVKTLPKSEILITVNVTPEEWQTFENEAAQVISEKIDVPGFRKGQAPKAFVIAQIGAEAFFEQTLQIGLPKSYFQAVKDLNLQVISRPDVKILSRSPLTYEARVATFPQVQLKGYENIKIPEEPISVTDEELNAVVEEMRKYRATYKPLERNIQKGDRVEIDFQGFDESGSAIEKTKSVNHPLFVGEGSLVEGFEDQLIGMKVGEKKKFPLKFPKDFQHESLRNKTVHFETEVKRAEEPILPELNEDFIASVMGERKSISEFQEAVKGDLHRRKKLDARRNRENTLLEKFLKDAKFDVPPVLVEEEVDYMVADLKRELEARGLKFETYVEKLAREKRDLTKEYTPEAEKRIRLRLILNFLFRSLRIEVNEEEMQKASQRLLERTPEADKPKLQENLSKKGDVYLRLKNNLMLEKLFAHFLD